MDLNPNHSESRTVPNSKPAMQKGAGSKCNSLALTAVALQDHISRSLQIQNLSLSAPLKKGHRNRLHNCKSVDKSVINPLVDTGLKNRKLLKKRCNGSEEKEYVLDPSPPAMTLAQKMGLVEAPAMPLTADDWIKVKERSVQQGESSQPCVICKEEFGLQQQVLLSCSHVFHRVCLQAFERFSGKKTCPMCRKELYETRVIHDGARLYKTKCATRIQACWRAYIVRKWYSHLRKTVPPKDTKLRRNFFEQKLQEMNDSFLKSCDTNIDEFLSEIDNSVASSKGVLHQFEKECGLEISEDTWEEIQLKAVLRETSDCPICITPLCHISSILHPTTSGDNDTHLSLRQTVLLSCSHVFHHNCLKAFEDFCVDERHICPLCRSLYQKRIL
ncbi:RING finger protein 32 [Acipenser ruthenus]|uniref:RING finger protein 32 n=1 Tax=Acipenser ruthenus TaxID=7906 RepID=UPI00155FBF5F|nr:RING finger protein 32 [Acipenser ruthenus]